MNYKLKSPCAKCPFRTDNGFELRVGFVKEIAEVDQPFACHETVDYPDDGGEGVVTERSQHCAGALILAEHMKRPHQQMRLMGRINCYDPEALHMDAPVFRSSAEMVRAYTIRQRAPRAPKRARR